MDTIFHAFNMRYSDIEALVPHLQELGVTHVQFPPIQPTRTLTEWDGTLLRAQVKLCGLHISQYAIVCAEARRKTEAFPPHTFDFLLRHRLLYIHQPSVRALHEGVLAGIPLTRLYETLLFADTASAATKAVLDYETIGTRSSWYPMVRAVDLLLAGVSPDPPDIAALDAAVAAAATTEGGSARTAWLRAKSARSDANKALELHGLLATAADLRRRVIACTEFQQSQPFRPPKDSTKTWNRIFALEYMLYPPWWILYQPLRLAIGQTPLGSVESIYAAIRACRAHGIAVIADVVVNNLAAVSGGERTAWAPYAKTPGAETLAASVTAAAADPVDDPVLRRLRQQLRDALGTEDLTTMTPPFDCNATQEPTLCWMSQALPQFKQDHPAVQAAQEVFLKQLADAGVSGLRIDAAVHMSPATCERILNTFTSYASAIASPTHRPLSYIEYVGGAESWRAFPFEAYVDRGLRMEDFSIGPCVYTTLFGPHTNLEKSKNYGATCLTRHPDLDSVVMLLNHDQLMGSIPSDVWTDLPSRHTYELSLVYLLQRVYGAVLLLPHEIASDLVVQAIQFRAYMRSKQVVRDYVAVNTSVVQCLKYTATGSCVGECRLDASTGSVLFRKHMENNVPSSPTRIYNCRTLRWMPSYRHRATRGKTKRRPRCLPLQN